MCVSLRPPVRCMAFIYFREEGHLRMCFTRAIWPSIACVVRSVSAMRARSWAASAALSASIRSYSSHTAASCGPTILEWVADSYSTARHANTFLCTDLPQGETLLPFFPTPVSHDPPVSHDSPGQVVHSGIQAEIDHKQRMLSSTFLWWFLLPKHLPLRRGGVTLKNQPPTFSNDCLIRTSR